MAQIATDRFSIGNVLGTSFEILFRNIVPFGLIAIVFYGIPTTLIGLLANGDTSGDGPSPSGSEAADAVANAAVEGGAMLVVIVVGILVFTVFMVLYHFVAATFVWGTVQDLRGQRVSIGECLSWAFSVAVPVAMVALLVTLAVGIGMMLLIIPGIILMVMFYVAMPVAVIERPGITASLGRSAELTSGYRWNLFWMLVILIIINMVVGGVWQFVQPMTSFMAMPVSMIIDAFFTALYAVTSAVTYVTLRGLKDGMEVDQIAAVFD